MVNRLFKFVILSVVCIGYIRAVHHRNLVGILQNESHEIAALLGYDPKITLIEDNNPLVVHTRPLLYLHGFGTSKRMIEKIKRSDRGSLCVPGDIITFNFVDAKERGEDVVWQKVSFGQKNDIITLLAILKKLDELDLDVDMYAFSRGCAVFINTVAVLCCFDDPVWQEEFDRLGISEEIKNRILKRIARSAHILDCPLKDVSLSLQKRIEDRIAMVSNYFLSLPKNTSHASNQEIGWLQTFSSRCKVVYAYVIDSIKRGLASICTTIGHWIYIPYLTHFTYKPWKERPIKMLSSITIPLTILVHYQDGDEMVGNYADQEYFDAIKGTKYLVIGSEGRHQHNYQAISETIHAFKKMHGGSYYDDPELLKQGKEKLGITAY